jgi:hypothetical protein
MDDLTIKRLRGVCKQIGELTDGETIPVSQLKSYGLWPSWVSACHRAQNQIQREEGISLREISSHPMLVKYKILRLRFFAEPLG